MTDDSQEREREHCEAAAKRFDLEAWGSLAELLLRERAAARDEALPALDAARAFSTSGYRNSLCGGAWEPLQENETWEEKAKCCAFCRDYATLRLALNAVSK